MPAAERRAVVIEDDPDIRDLLKMVLVQSGFDTVAAPDGPQGIEAVRAHDPVLTTLDVSMPGMDGFAVAARLREFSSTYIIMLTGQADEIDVIQGLQSGADDYLLKPFRPRELRVRIEAMLRRPRGLAAEAEAGAEGEDAERTTTTPAAARSAPSTDFLVPGAAPLIPQPGAEPAPAPVQTQQPVQPVQAPEPVQAQQPVEPVQAQQAVVGTPGGPDAVQWRGLAADVGTRVAVVDGRPVDLTRTEFDLLVTLLQTGRRVRSKADLVLTLRGESYVTTYYVTDADKRGIEVHMANLRRKLGDSSATPRWIETVRGVGYRLAGD
ncbi:hypothetical protein ASD11_12055 [Aeromicrobium sp. Root495]|uniref:response regulator transcription factor n=1 Tax=Aeromicrobium sp. Root495 TaxID=1736550 RepID=UPI0006F7DCD1|nr:response regulator transcription factor [Aeromicrobium sp. Root495]KQY60198.1 hypothetical protein ASD11_12055 [Aeromicrobium sp. Root495]